MNVLTKHHNIEERQVISILETIEVATGKREILKEFDYLIEAPNWLRNGSELIYNAGGYIYSYEIASGTSRLIDTEYCNHCNNDHVLSPDHNQLAVSHHTYEDGQSRIYRIPIEGGQPVLITPIAPSYLHGWSPDGERLTYCAERNGEYDIFTIPAKGGIETQLTTSPGLNDGPEYSPDGQYIWFNSVRSGLMQLWRMIADGSEQIQMTFDESNSWFAHLSPDGTTVAYITYRKGDVEPGDHPANKEVEIRCMSSEGGDYRTLVQLFGGQGSLNVNSWSPCGRKLAFVSYRLK
ncbi:MAG: periplasmic component of the Tol biopolymer transport system [Herbinix sp.]|jgi:Tol biopolymer transport system component|nr:periplasmic component of the Tol biopolymer transport system [Herbinix sp.]